MPERGLGVLLAAALLTALMNLACGSSVDIRASPTGNGPLCYSDSDCVPNACCGQGTAAVFVDQGPSCAGVACDASCSPGTVHCGCGVPVCRDGQCTVAYTVKAGC